jgi:predicted  nucleic acid-binding Zn-ribbon protein
MDHKYINEFDLVERYLMGRLAADETAQFEEHFVDCVQCVDQLKVTKALMEGLRFVARDRTLGAGPRIPKNFGYYSRKPLALAAAVLALLALAGGALLLNQIRRAGAEADQARSASIQWEGRYEQERQSSANAEKQHQESETELNEQVAQLRTELEHKREQEPARTGEVNVAILALSATRGNEAGARNEISLPRAPRSVFLSVLLEEERKFKTYRMTIESSLGQVIWKRDGFKPDAHNLFSARLSSTLLRSGNYLLTLAGVARDGSTSVVDTYPFRVRKAP